MQTAWCNSAAGEYVLAWQARRYAACLHDVSASVAVQLGLLDFPALAACRAARRYRLAPAAPVGVDCCADFAQLPLAAECCDLIALPHTLELSTAPAATLRDVARALRPWGYAILSGFHQQAAWYGWGLQAQRRKVGLPAKSAVLNVQQLQRQLQAVGLQVQRLDLGCWQSLHGAAQPYRAEWQEALGQRLWPQRAASFVLLAQKQQAAPQPGDRSSVGLWQPSPSF